MLLPAMLSGCAAIFAGPYQLVTIKTDLPAKVWIDGRLVGETPVEIGCDRTQSHTIILARPGFAPVVIRPESEFKVGYVLGDIIGTLAVGVVIDAIYGYWYELSPSTITVRLLPNTWPPNAPLQQHIPQAVSP